MNWMSPIVITPLLSGVAFILASHVMAKFPPKDINVVFGYRTKTSMRSQVHWDFAQHYVAKELRILGIVQCVVSLSGLLMNASAGIGTVLGVGIVIFFLALLILKPNEH